MQIGLELLKSQDLKEDLLQTELENNYENAIDWVNRKYSIEDPYDRYDFCVVREKIKLISDCLKFDIPLRIDLNKKQDFNINKKFKSIFDIKQDHVDFNHKLWISIFSDDLNRDIRIVSRTQAIKDLMNKKELFIKSLVKGFSRVFSLKNDFNNIDKKLIKTLNASYGKHWFEFEDLQLGSPTQDNINLLKQRIGEENYLESAIRAILISFYDRENEVIISEVRPFKSENEFRCIFVGNKIHSISERIDYLSFSKRTQNDYAIVYDYCIYLAEKYYTKVPYKIWNADVCLVNGKLEIVEAHLYCNMLGHFLHNQNYTKYMALLSDT